MRRITLGLAVTALSLAPVAGARAQQEPARDSVARDSVARDSVARDSVARDSVARGTTLDSAIRDSVETAEESQSDLRHAAVFFAERKPLEMTLTTNLRALRRQTGDENPYRDAVLEYRLEGQPPVAFPVGVRTRGIFRLKMCDFPPIRMRLRRKDRTGTVLEGLRRPKVVTYCKDRDEYEQYVLQEFLAYRIYEALTPISLRARLVHMTFVDSASGERATSRYGIVLEEEEALAARLEGQVLEAHGAQPRHLDPYQATLLAVFQYLIGNTDWSIPALHNIVLIQTVNTVHPVAYDFDFAGLVRARYAAPDPKLGIQRVTQRLYRGSCATVNEIPLVLDHVRSRKDEILAILDEPIGLTDRNARHVRDFVGDFFERIEDPGDVRSAIVSQCVPVR